MAVSNDIRNGSLLTTGQIGRLCSVSHRTVAKWIDEGHLPGWRVPTGDAEHPGERRVPSDVVAAFLDAYGMVAPRQKLNELIADKAREPVFFHGYVYFIRVIGKPPIKIGYSSNPLVRMSKMRVMLPTGDVECLGVMRGSYACEAKLHARFAAHRLQGEWFDPAPEILAYIAVHCVSPEEMRRSRSSLRSIE